MLRWKNLKLSGKFVVAFGLVLGLLVIVAGWSAFGVNGIVRDAEEVIAGNQLRGGIAQRELDHLKWANAMNALLTDDQVRTLNIETDHTRCRFGEWYYGEPRREASRTWLEVQMSLAPVQSYGQPVGYD